MKEEGGTCIWQVCSQYFEQLTSRSQVTTTAPLRTRISSFAFLKSVNFSILNK